MPTDHEPRARPDPSPGLPPGLVPAWAAAPRPRRGPKPAHTVAQVVAAAVELADAEGLAAASLPNIAAALGLTTNALYRYVDSKDELLVLLADAGFGPPPPVGDDAPDWRAAVRAWAHAALDRYRARPWLLDVPFRGGPVTPHRLAWTERLLAVLATAGVSGAEALGCATLVADVTRTTAEHLRARTDPDATDPDPTDADATGRAADVRAFLRPLLAERGYPHLAALVDRGGFPAATAVDFGLDRVLDGIAALVAASRA
ncbi:TetR/AcrR family transcriptional regulator [Saccharothrix yanglingensis]|uniref:TetR family transcriptional regulator n=1 Tax=Saccharothrix yanglingensis TaxID=659496 RepID=A0ABU0WUU1_9PSEU|nr:TetR/AcrR family transcriptional regulator [Saccharothrix yanglingensis]MDQ2583542.1 TetR family transcriptional regulator [Saccharothrix yanglingensis]